jgi:hypothetical protein
VLVYPLDGREIAPRRQNNCVTAPTQEKNPKSHKSHLRKIQINTNSSAGDELAPWFL